MKLSDINDWLTLGANIGVVAGIVFLGVELGQNNELMESQARFNRLEVARSAPEAILNQTSIDWGAAIFKAESDLTTDEANAVSVFRYSTFLGWEWTFTEIPQDEIPVDQWRRSFRSVLAQNVWKQRKHEFRPDFVVFMEARVARD